MQQEIDAKRLQEENFLKEKRAEILKEESEKAHFLAQEHREKQKELEEKRKEEEILNYVRPGGIVMYGTIDYSKTHFHNPVILKHDFQGKSAKDLAENEEEEALIRMQTKEDTKNMHQKKAEIRGSKALMQVAVEKKLALLAKELEKIRVADGNVKIEKGINDPVVQNRCIAKSGFDEKKKQKMLEKMFEEMIFVEEPVKTGKSGMVWKDDKDDKEGKKEILSIPQPKNEESFRICKEKIGKNEENIEVNTNLLRNAEDNEEIEDDKSVEDFQISESEESDREVLAAKYEPKPIKRKPVKKNQSSKKKAKKTIKFGGIQKSPEENDFDFDEHEEFKDELENEYTKHLEIKKELENLKRFKQESIEKKEKSEKDLICSSQGPPSVTSSQISPSSPFFTKKIDLEEEKFDQTSAFPPVDKNSEVFNVYSKFKSELVSNPIEKLQYSYDEVEEKSSFEEPPHLQKNFLDEMKFRYGIVKTPEVESKKVESKKVESRKVESKNAGEVLEKDYIFSEHTLKLKKEIEEKYSFDKYNFIKEQEKAVSESEEEDLRYAIPLSRPFTHWEEPESSDDDRGKSQEQYLEEDFSNEKPSEQEDFSNEKPSEQEDFSSEKPSEQESISVKGQEFPQEDSQDSQKFLYDKNFFDEIKNKYGITSGAKNSSEKSKEFSYKFQFDDENSEESEKKSGKNRGFVMDFNENKGKNRGLVMDLNENQGKNKGLVMDFNENQGKSLAEIFKEKKRGIAEKIDQREGSIPKAMHKEKTRDELMEIRKELLKSKVEKPKIEEIEEKKQNSVLERLGKGEKPKISKKEMHDLTKKNYELLPEVQKKKEEERKKQEIRERIQKSKEFEKVKTI